MRSVETAAASREDVRFSNLEFLEFSLWWVSLSQPFNVFLTPGTWHTGWTPPCRWVSSAESKAKITSNKNIFKESTPSFMDKVRNAKDTEWNGNKRQEMLTSEYGICQTRKELHGQVGGCGCGGDRTNIHKIGWSSPSSDSYQVWRHPCQEFHIMRSSLSPNWTKLYFVP